MRTRAKRRHSRPRPRPMMHFGRYWPIASLRGVAANGRFWGELCCKTRLRFAGGADLSVGQLVAFSAERLTASRHTGLTGYAAQGTGANGGVRQRNLTRRRRFCAVAVSSTSSLAPLKPRSRNRSSLRMRFMCANCISTFLRSRRDCSKASVLASARATSRASS